MAHWSNAARPTRRPRLGDDDGLSVQNGPGRWWAGISTSLTPAVMGMREHARLDYEWYNPQPPVCGFTDDLGEYASGLLPWSGWRRLRPR